ncbi:Ycf36 (chloroplast) [Porphyra umbilicalis]|uniref:Ycf36 n=1 Tax=Porphyra umbilicalis TaxID=2786 RepID=J7F8F2_PORUM|nr:Ycf36 [Porphyra umbilicalis]AFC39942.1 Ycf36 [Porphyra umbilicalis]ASN78746.1 Ycf36 [Porphyra umbilicalis]|eukprot:ASN78746.1 Ycf36 (chloroplast) [Porphyra umbilicalis]
MNLYNNQCPVPLEQQPVNEYNSLKNSWFFCWPTLSSYSYNKKITITLIVSCFLVSPILLSIFPIAKLPLKFFFSEFITSSLITCFILIRLYLGWSYVVKRLMSATVFYEESGWYDGQIWVKPSEILVKDRFIGLYEVFPLLNKIKNTLSCLSLMTTAPAILFFYF